MYYIGIDGGGTKSRLVGTDLNFNVLGTCQSGSTNLNSTPYETVLGHINTLLTEFCSLTNMKLDDCAGFCIGSAGVDTPSDVTLMEKLIKETGLTCPITVVNDAELGLASETKGSAGVVVISGTGSIAFADNGKGHRSRCGGWGHMIDDGGSGFWIGKEAVNRALMAYDGRLPHTVLLEKIKNHFNLQEIHEILPIIYAPDFSKSKIAELSMYVMEAAKEDDKISLDIQNEAATALFTLAETLINKYQIYSCKVIISGGIIVNNTYIRNYFSKLLTDKYKDISICEIKEKPEMGAVFLASQK